MSRNSEEQILQHLKNGISRLTPDDAGALWEQPVSPADGTEWYLDSVKKPVRRSRWISALAACLVLCILSGVLFQSMPSASVCLDVNPSIMLDVNYRNRVTKATACNEDAAEILGEMDLSGTDLDVALYAILGSMVHHGYLTTDADTILVSVHSGNRSRADALEAEVTGMVSQSLRELIHAGEILSCQLSEDDLAADVSHSGCTPGKAAFIGDLLRRYPQLEEDDLEDLSIDEIVSLLKQEHLDYSDYSDEDDEDDWDDDDDLSDDEVEEDRSEPEDTDEDDRDEDDEDDEDDGDDEDEDD